MATQKRTKWEALEEYVADLQRALNVAEWRVTIAQEASDVEAWADINPSEVAKTAELRVSHDFWAQTPERQREVLTHEMLHLLTARLDHTVEAMEEPLGKLAWAVFDRQYEMQTERLVDHLAILLAPSVPLPDFPRS